MELVPEMSAESTGTASVQASKYRPQAGDKRFGRSTVTNHKDLLPQLDGRTGAARRFRDLVNAFIVDMGGLENCSEIKLGLLRRLAAATVQAERLEALMINGEAVDVPTLCTLASTTVRLAQRIGIDRVARDVTPTLDDIAAEIHAARSQGGPP
jgi:hypothetical protein